MKTDRELLELAAKAAGYILEVPDDADGIFVMREKYRNGHQWNPLADDGDALRLAVKCGISVGPESADVIGKSLCRASWLNKTHSLGEYGDGDPYAATRRAIVRAAAAIGGGYGMNDLAFLFLLAMFYPMLVVAIALSTDDSKDPRRN